MYAQLITLNKAKMVIFELVLLGITIALAAGITPLQIALSKSSSSSHHHHTKSSSSSSPSINPNSLPNYQTNQSTAHLYFAPPPPTSTSPSPTSKTDFAHK